MINFDSNQSQKVKSSQDVLDVIPEDQLNETFDKDESVDYEDQNEEEKKDGERASGSQRTVNNLLSLSDNEENKERGRTSGQRLNNGVNNDLDE